METAGEEQILEQLERRLRFEKMIAQISLAFIPAANGNEPFEDACRLLGQGTGVSRVYVFENFDNNAATCNTVEWVNDGIAPVKDKLQSVPYDSIRYWRIALENGETIRADDIRSLPDDVYTILEWQGIKSVLVVPLNMLGRWHGFLGFDECVAQRRWHDDEVAIIETAARIISTAMEKRQLERNLVHSGRLSVVGTLAAGVAHEYNNLHAGMLGLVELALETPGLSDQVRADLGRVQSLVRRGAELTRKLLDLSRRRKSIEAPVNMAEVVDDCLSILKPGLKAGGVTVAAQLLAPRSWVKGDQTELGQVVINVVLNAMEAMQGSRNRHLSITTWNTPMGGISISVEDTGQGIAPDALPKLFDPFFTTKGKLGGGTKESTGLGLWIAQQIVYRHKGMIAARNRPTGGAVFEITLPCSDDGAQQRAAAEPLSAEPSPRLHGRVGVVDDEPDILEMLHRVLSRAGHHVEAFLSPAAALAAANERKFDLFLVDLVMPAPGGAWLLDALAKLPAEQRPLLVLMTGQEPGKAADETADLSVDARIEKPFITMGAVPDAVHKVLAGKGGKTR